MTNIPALSPGAVAMRWASSRPSGRPRSTATDFFDLLSPSQYRLAPLSGSSGQRLKSGSAADLVDPDDLRAELGKVEAARRPGDKGGGFDDAHAVQEVVHRGFFSILREDFNAKNAKDAKSAKGILLCAKAGCGKPAI